jgi:mono/diheme cytochrome c family protein
METAMTEHLRLSVTLSWCGTAITMLGADAAAQEIPRTWSDSAIAAFELPLASPAYSPEHVSEDYSYALPERTIWKSYAIYHPNFEPPGYRDSLALLEPEVALDASTFETEADWIQGGDLVFHAPIAYDGAVRPQDVVDARWYQDNRVGVTADGILPWARWVVRQRGTLEVGNLSCAMCHTRLMPDGSVIEGAQGNFPFEWVTAWRIREGDTPPPIVRTFGRVLAATPWIADPMRHPDTLSQLPLETLAAMRAAVPPGVLIRQGTAFDAPARIPDLIGVRERKYLDATGLVVHRSPGDLMRYAAANQVLDILARYGSYVPATSSPQRPPPGMSPVPGSSDRYSEAQLYALTQYLYSLEPPRNPNPMDELAQRGSRIFESESCTDCHTPPLYTNNQLVPAPGFEPPDAHYLVYDVSERRVNTDPTLTMTTRRGTGYYKVPSLKGLWYRGPLQHSGAVATLEDWFDPARRNDDYVPTGFRGIGDESGAVEGHPFGLTLSIEDRRALIAFLRTL